MAEMQWYAATDSGRFDGTAVITPRSGAVCLRAELPAGVLQKCGCCASVDDGARRKALHERLPNLDRLPGAGQMGPAARC